MVQTSREVERAPELYEALKDSTDLLSELARFVSDDQMDANNEQIARNNAALAKARGSA